MTAATATATEGVTATQCNTTAMTATAMEGATATATSMVAMVSATATLPAATTTQQPQQRLDSTINKRWGQMNQR